MMSLNFAAITPHPPIIIPEVGGVESNKCLKTIKAMGKLSDKISETNPQTIIMISPHALIHPDRFAVYASPKFYGDLGQFGASEVSFKFNNDLEIAQKITERARENGLEAFLFGDPNSDYAQLDHGEMVPMYFLKKNLSTNTRIIPIAYSSLSKSQHFAFGQVLRDVCNNDFPSDDIAIVASGDLSHRLIQGAPAGYSKAGKEFDKTLVNLIKNKYTQDILEMDEEFVEAAGECGYRSILILLGALDGLDYQPEILSYEGPFGVGYLVANFKLNS